MSDNTFHTEESGHADVTLKLRGRGGTVLVIGDPDIDFATIALRPAQPGDAAAQACIDAAEATSRGRRLRVTVPKAAPITTGLGTGHSVTITGGGPVIAGNIGGSGNTGSVSTATPGPGITAEVRVPAGSQVYILAQDTPVTMRGDVDAEIDTSGVVRTEPLGQQ
ncbi:hypothetical protein [Nocardia acidivorans]|uniref:hypothetical protein n=1 Tax=Nocardia acidivorans TaxID=404580 RepID=UPI000ADE59D0|nr:hypothetical protein [Nocardia acidivorans]